MCVSEQIKCKCVCMNVHMHTTTCFGVSGRAKELPIRLSEWVGSEVGRQYIRLWALYVYVCIRICTHTHKCAPVFVCPCVCVCTHMYVCVYECMRVVCISAYACMCACMSVCVRGYVKSRKMTEPP